MDYGRQSWQCTLQSAGALPEKHGHSDVCSMFSFDFANVFLPSLAKTAGVRVLCLLGHPQPL